LISPEAPVPAFTFSQILSAPDVHFIVVGFAGQTPICMAWTKTIEAGVKTHAVLGLEKTSLPFDPFDFVHDVFVMFNSAFVL
jgi:hypothetical protein